MSPSEDDLRAALHRGEGPGLDPAAALATARAAASRRRTLFAVGSGTAVALLAVGTAVGVTLSGGNGHHVSAAGSASHRQASAARADSANGEAASGSVSSPRSSARSHVREAASPDVRDNPGLQPPALPGRVATGRPAKASAPVTHAVTLRCPASYAAPSAGRGAGTVLTSSVSSVLVCAYGQSGTARSGSTTLTGSDARALAQSLNSAPATQPQVMCSDRVGQLTDQHTYMFVGLAGGKATQPVSAYLSSPACGLNVNAASASASRYMWSPPTSITARLKAL